MNKIRRFLVRIALGGLYGRYGLVLDEVYKHMENQPYSTELNTMRGFFDSMLRVTTYSRKTKSVKDMFEMLEKSIEERKGIIEERDIK